MSTKPVEARQKSPKASGVTSARNFCSFQISAEDFGDFSETENNEKVFEFDSRGFKENEEASSIF